MVAKIRNLSSQFEPTHISKFDNLLVSGCSFTWNNSESAICSWPYYLRDLVGFKQIFDCSQSGAGTNHIFNSVVNEIETNPAINPESTLIIIMWSGLTRTDVIAHKDVTAEYHHMSNYNFNDKFSTLSLPNNVGNFRYPVDQLAKTYKLFVDTDAQIYESMLKILALESYLQNKKFKFLFTSWMNPRPELVRINSPLGTRVFSLLDSITYLDEYASYNGQKQRDGHPTPDGYLEWTRNHLIPYLTDQKFIGTAHV